MNIKHLSFMLLLCCTMHSHATDSRARVFAFNLKTEIIDDVFYATFLCNTAFQTGKVFIYQPTTDHITADHTPALTIDFTPTSEGVMMDGALVRVPIPENQMTEEMLQVLNWAVELTGTAITQQAELVEYTDPTDNNITFYCPQSIAINTNPYSPSFADIYIAQAANGRATDDADESDDWYNAAKYERTKTQKKGIFVYNPIFEEKNPYNQGYLPNNINWHERWRHDMHRIAINPTNDHLTFAYAHWSNADWKQNTTAIYDIDPCHLRGEAHAFSATNISTGSPLKRAHSLCYDNTGALYVLDSANINATGTNASGKLYRKTNDTWEIFLDGTTQGNQDQQNHTVGLWPTLDNALASDGRGGVWVAQYRKNFLTYSQVNGKPQWDLYPILVHVSANGEVDFMVTQRSTEDTIQMFTNGHSTDGTGASNKGQLAYWEKEDILAFAGNKRVTLYKTTYDTNGKPTLTKWLATPEIAADIDGIAFDYVGNLHVLSHTTQRLYAFALPKADNRCFTPAPRKVITIDQEIDNTTSYAMNFYQSMPPNSIVDVKLLRPFTDQYWQTLILPFDLNRQQTQNLFGEWSDVAVLAHSYLKAEEWFYLRFDFVDTVQQGLPCLVHPSHTLPRGAIVENVNLSTVVKTVATPYTQMHGIFAPIDFNEHREQNPEDNYYFLAPDQLLSNNAAQTMLALRAYFNFQLTKEQMLNLRAKVVFEDDLPTELKDMILQQEQQPTKLLRNGQLIIRHNGMEFTPQGQRIQ